MNSILIFVLPLIVSMLPLLALIGFTQFSTRIPSALATFLHTIACVFGGGISSVLAMLISMAGLSHSIPGNGPKCVTGATGFLFIGGFFMLLTLLCGLYLTISRAIRRAD